MPVRDYLDFLLLLAPTLFPSASRLFVSSGFRQVDSLQ